MGSCVMDAVSPLRITFSRKAFPEDSVEFSFSAVVADPESAKGALSPEELLTSVGLSIHKAGQSVCSDRLQQTLNARLQASNDPA
jgi:hypothetical protein